MEVARAAVERHGARDGAVFRRQQPRGDEPVGDLDARALQAAVQHLLDVVALGHRQHVRAHVVDLAHRVVARLVLFELDAPAVQLLDHGVAVLRVRHHGGLVDDAVVGDGDLLDVLLRRREARHDRVVQAIHAHRDGAAALDVGLFQQQHAQLRVRFLGLHGGHRAGRAAADHEHVDGLNLRFHIGFLKS